MNSRRLYAVTDLSVLCGLRVRNFGEPGLAQSDCCGAPADTAVQMDSGVAVWRCREHRGIQKKGPHPEFLLYGHVITHVALKDS